MPTVNGQEHQHSNIDLQVVGGVPVRLRKFSALSYKVTGNKKPVYDAQGKVCGYTIENEQLTASITLLRTEWIALQKRLRARPENVGLGIGQIACDWAVSVGPSPTTLETDQLFGVMFQESGLESQSSQDAHAVTIPLFVPKILFSTGEFIEVADAA